MGNKFLTLIVLFLSMQSLWGQQLKPGFDSDEYFELLKVSSRQGDTLYNPDLPSPKYHQRLYRSPVMGLENRWELWESTVSKTAVISIRGTVNSQLSWVENFFCAMVAAKGSIKLSNEFTFEYELAQDEDAAIHVGYLTATGFLSRDMLPKIDSLYKKNIKEFSIIGHSQGGGISILLSAYLENLKAKGELPSDMIFKTYSSAGPKPGNLYFAYDYEYMMREGWAFNVVNTADWVPEGPFSIQTTDDYNSSNPFRLAKAEFKHLPFKQRIVVSRLYKNLEKPPKKANKRYQKYLGKMIGNNIQGALPGFEMPPIYNSNNYVRTGSQIILHTNKAYYKIFPEDPEMIWNHHMFEAYMFLLNGTVVPMTKIKINQ